MTWRPPNSARSWATCTSPDRTIWSGRRLCSGTPSKRICPLVALMSPASARRVVVLPAPFAPMSETISPAQASRWGVICWQTLHRTELEEASHPC